jgi:hypothetical protein
MSMQLNPFKVLTLILLVGLTTGEAMLSQTDNGEEGVISRVTVTEEKITIPTYQVDGS